MSPIEAIAELLHERMGFDTGLVNSPQGLKLIDERRVATGSASLEDYALLLRKSLGECAILVELIVVPETFFFRYPESFDALVEWAQRHPREQLRILSLACSTGEEVYSIAMKLMDAGFPSDRFYIEGRDISAKAVATANLGVYHRNSFRTEAPAWRASRFREDAGEWTIDPKIHRVVRFETGNLLELEDENLWDVIFCRNVLIYFSESRRADAIRRISRALIQDGILFLGPAEPAVLLDMGWASSGYAMSFACVRKLETPERKRPSSLPPPPAPQKIKPRQAARPFSAPVAPVPQKAATPTQLEQARQLADSGQLEQARGLLQTIVRETPSSVEANFLRGLVEETIGREDLAEDCYRRTLYLDPSHTDAMQHLALLLSRQGRSKAAGNLRRRANISADKP